MWRNTAEAGSLASREKSSAHGKNTSINANGSCTYRRVAKADSENETWCERTRVTSTMTQGKSKLGQKDADKVANIPHLMPANGWYTAGKVLAQRAEISKEWKRKRLRWVVARASVVYSSSLDLQAD